MYTLVLQVTCSRGLGLHRVMPLSISHSYLRHSHMHNMLVGGWSTFPLVDADALKRLFAAQT